MPKFTVPAILALALLLLAFALFFVTILVPLEGAPRDLVMVIVGGILALLTQVYSFYFGSSEGSRKKDKSQQTLATTGYVDVKDTGPNPPGSESNES